MWPVYSHAAFVSEAWASAQRLAAGREPRSLKTAAALKNYRHRRLTRVLSKRPLSVGDRPDSDRYCWRERI